MNFLAHLHLAEPTPHSYLGNLLGDFVKGYPWDDRFPETVWKGIVEHRQVDAFTDRHPLWNESRDLLPVSLRRFAGIVVDIYYDYFLHRHWSRFSPTTDLDSFLGIVERSLASVETLAPPGGAIGDGTKVEQQWLREYATLAGIDRTLERVQSGVPFLEPIFETSELLRSHLPEMERHFLAFYPDLVGYVSEIRNSVFPESGRHIPESGRHIPESGRHP